MNNIEKLTEVVDELRGEVGQWAQRIENIEFALGIVSSSAKPLDSEALDEIKSRLFALESALGIE